MHPENRLPVRSSGFSCPWALLGPPQPPELGRKSRYSFHRPGCCVQMLRGQDTWDGVGEPQVEGMEGSSAGDRGHVRTWGTVLEPWTDTGQALEGQWLELCAWQVESASPESPGGSQPVRWDRPGRRDGVQSGNSATPAPCPALLCLPC